MSTCIKCEKPLSRVQKRFCSHSCQFIYLNENRQSKWVPTITPEMHEILEGVMFSDGHLELNKTSNYPRLQVNMMADKKEYLDYLADQLGVSKDRIKFRNKYNRVVDKNYPSYAFSTTTSVALSEYYKRWYPNGTKVIPLDFEITPTSLLHAFIGDGCWQPKGPRIFIYTNNFPNEDVDRFIEQLKVLNIRATKRCTTRNKEEYSVSIANKKSIQSFFEYIAMCPVDCFKYKFDNVQEVVKYKTKGYNLSV